MPVDEKIPVSKDISRERSRRKVVRKCESRGFSDFMGFFGERESLRAWNNLDCRLESRSLPAAG